MGSTAELAVVTGAPTVQSTTKRTGTYALRCNAAAAVTRVAFRSLGAAAAARSLYQSLRCWMRLDTAPGSLATIAQVGDIAGATARWLLRMNADRTLQGAIGATTSTSTNVFALDSAFHSVEVDVGWNAGQGLRVYVDGVEWLSVASVGATLQDAEGRLGWGNTVTADVYFDDVVWDDAALGGTLWGAWSVPLSKPISDNARGNWTGGAAGTTNLFSALDNQPPVGLTAGSDTDTSQIQNATSATFPGTAAQRGDWNCQTYTTLGIAPWDTLWAVQAACNHGEGIATGTKPGGLYIVSNPAQASPGLDFDYGNDVGAIGTFPFTTAGTPTIGWFTAVGPVTASPSVTLGTSPVVGVHKNVASTRETHVDFAGVYVAFTPGLPPELSGRPFGLHGQAQMHQLLSQ